MTKTLSIDSREGQSKDAALAEIAFSGFATHAHTAELFLKGTMGELGLMESIEALKKKAAHVHKGNMTESETMLTAQAATLDAIFIELSRRAALNMGEYMNATETYLRLALKAQSQCRTTLETLAEIKSPRSVAFVKQANIAGNQQVNNGSPPLSRAEKNKNQPNELLLEEQHHETLDTGRTATAGGADKELEAMGALDRN